VSPIRPGPQPGYRPPTDPNNPVTNNGRPREKARGFGQAEPARDMSNLQPGSASQVPMAPPIPQVGFTVPWYGMGNPLIPQPVAEIGRPSFNSLSGEWYGG
jgi:hypothetical protein